VTKPESSLKKIRIWAYITPSVKEILAQRARDEHNSESETVTKALTMYLTRDVTDESELVAKMSEIIRQTVKMRTMLEAGQKLDLEWYQYFFMFTPELPANEKERKILLEKAAKRTHDFLANFRRRIKMLPHFLETIFGSMLEEDDTTGEIA
jgi:hypothetical protein